MLYPSYRHCSAQHRRGKLDLVHRLERGDVVELDVRVERGREHPGTAVGEAQRRHCLGVRGDAGEEAAAGQQVPELDVVPAGRGHEGIVGEEQDGLDGAAVIHGGHGAVVAVLARVPHLDGVVIGAGDQQGGGAARGATGPHIVLERKS